MRAFAHKGNSVFYFDKDNAQKSVQARNILKILKMPHLYSDIASGGRKIPRVEIKFASEIDDKIPDFVRSIEEAILSGLSWQKYTELIHFSEKLLVNFFYRSPYTRSRAKRTVLSRGANFLSHLAFFLENTRFPNPSERNAIANNLTQDVIGRAHHQKLGLHRFTLCFVSPHETECFITGSNPVVVQFPRGLRFFRSNPSVQNFYFLPLSPKAGLMYTDQVVETVIVALSEGSAHSINQLIFSQSKRIVSHDKDLLSRYALAKFS